MSGRVTFDVRVLKDAPGSVPGDLFSMLKGRTLRSDDVGRNYESPSGRWTATLTDCSTDTHIVQPSQLAVQVLSDQAPMTSADGAAKYLASDLMAVASIGSGPLDDARRRLAALEGVPSQLLVERLEAGLARKGRLHAWSRRHYTSVLPYLDDMGDVSPLILLTGDPGTGKTVAAESAPWIVAERLGEPVRLVRTNDRIRGEGIQGRAGAVIGELFDSLATTSLSQDIPCIAIIDEADAILSSRGASDLGSGAHENLAAVNAFLVNLDKLGRSHARLMFVMITNLPERIDPAAIRRAQLINFPRLDREGVAHLIQKNLGSTFTKDVLDQAIRELVNLQPPVTGSDIFQQVIYPLTRSAVSRDSTLDSELLRDLVGRVRPTPKVVR